MKLSPIVKKESLRVAIGSFVFCVIMILVFMLVGHYNTLVLLGGFYSTALASLNFFLMCVSKQKEIDMDKSRAKSFSMLSYNLRTLAILVLVIVGYALLDLNLIALLIPLLFPRIVILFITFKLMKNKGDENTDEYIG